MFSSSSRFSIFLSSDPLFCSSSVSLVLFFTNYYSKYTEVHISLTQRLSNFFTEHPLTLQTVLVCRKGQPINLLGVLGRTKMFKIWKFLFVCFFFIFSLVACFCLPVLCYYLLKLRKMNVKVRCRILSLESIFTFHSSRKRTFLLQMLNSHKCRAKHLFLITKLYIFLILNL